MLAPPLNFLICTVSVVPYSNLQAYNLEDVFNQYLYIQPVSPIFIK